MRPMLENVKRWKCQGLTTIGRRFWRGVMHAVCWGMCGECKIRVLNDKTDAGDGVIQSIKSTYGPGSSTTLILEDFFL